MPRAGRAGAAPAALPPEVRMSAPLATPRFETVSPAAALVLAIASVDDDAVTTLAGLCPILAALVQRRSRSARLRVA